MNIVLYVVQKMGRHPVIFLLFAGDERVSCRRPCLSIQDTLLELSRCDLISMQTGCLSFAFSSSV